MMRYWKIIFISVIIIGSIGTYYVQNARAGSLSPEFTIEGTSGDEREVEGLVLRAIFGSQGGFGEEIEISADGTTYRSHLPYLQQFEFHDHPDIDRLQEEHRNFMRGKEENMFSFFENEDTLVYVGPPWSDDPNLPLQVEILDKETEEVHAFDVDLPDHQEYMYMNLEDVQLINNDLHVVTTNVRRGSTHESDTEEVRVYRIDVENEELKSDQTLYSTAEGNEADWVHVNGLNHSNPLGEKDYYVFGINQIEEAMTHESTNEKYEYAAYHFETEELNHIQLPEEMETGGLITHVAQGAIYFVSSFNQVLEVGVYDLEKGEIDRIEVQATEGSSYPNSTMDIQDGKLYVVNSDGERAKLYVVDQTTEEVLYEGKIGFADPESVPDNYYLDFLDMRVE
jgi:hypothetical protein